jgi:hypothetical protein
MSRVHVGLFPWPDALFLVALPEDSFRFLGVLYVLSKAQNTSWAHSCLSVVSFSRKGRAAVCWLPFNNSEKDGRIFMKFRMEMMPFVHHPNSAF